MIYRIKKLDRSSYIVVDENNITLTSSLDSWQDAFDVIQDFNERGDGYNEN